jgi:hypothetical protein
LLLELLDAAYNLATRVEVFPEGNLATVDEHLVEWVMNLLTTKLYE